MAKPRALLFGLDGVLIDSEPLHLLAWRQAFARLNVEVRPGDLAGLLGRRTEQQVGQWAGATGLPKAHRLDVEAAISEQRRIFADSLDRLIPTPGAEAFLRNCKGELPLALVTSANLKLVGRILLRLGWRNIFDALIGAEHVGAAKPHGEPFLKAAARFKLNAAECLAFEDAAIGIKAARAAGVPVCGVTTTLSARRLRRAGAQWAIDNFRPTPILNEAMSGEASVGLGRRLRNLFSP